MSEQESKTLQSIREAALREFLEKGYQGASLRNMVKTAGVTTGAFYGYYRSKEALFEALVGPHADHLMRMYDDAVEEFWRQSPEEQERNVGDVGSRCMRMMVDYCYEHTEACRLLFTGAAGTRYENFMHELVEKEIAATHDFEEKLSGRGYPVTQISPQLEHIITSGMFSAMTEPLIHGLPREEALHNVAMVHEFYTAGWKHIMGFTEKE